MLTRVIFFFLVASLFIACKQEAAPAPSSGSSLWDFKTLGGTTWVLTAYHDTIMTQNMTPNDTLVFLDDTRYTYNGIAGTYQYYFYHNSMHTHLVLNNTPFGDIGAMVPDNTDTYGLINGAKFSSTLGVWYMWLVRQ